jgi:choline monooxygenase
MGPKADAALRALVEGYDASAPLERAWTIPASWYVDPRIAELENRTTFRRTWQLVGRLDQVARPGDFLTDVIAGEPVVVVHGDDGALRGFFNVCRHHAAAVMTEAQGSAKSLRCPYHGWTYGLDGALKGTPDFAGVCDFDKGANGLVPIGVAVWEAFVFVRLDGGDGGDDGDDGDASIEAALGPQLVAEIARLGLARFHFQERRRYAFECNWKVFVDNYLDGGYHVPYLHKGLDSVLDYAQYTIENGARYCLQKSPIVREGAEPQTGAVRQGDEALYYWIHPNFMINWYEGVMDTNLVRPLGVDRTEVIFDFYFTNVGSEEARARNRASIDVGQRIQDEDTDICRSVQRGLTSSAYRAGRLSVRREAGEHLFHRLLHADLKSGLD